MQPEFRSANVLELILFAAGAIGAATVWKLTNIL
jgi:hypothetical protein